MLSPIGLLDLIQIYTVLPDMNRVYVRGIHTWI
jgi:hypothetical protein